MGSARANEIEAIKRRLALAAGDGDYRFEPPDLRELVRLLTGMEEAIIGAGIADNHWRVPAGRLEDLAKRVPAMDLTTERSLDDKTHALAEVMINAVYTKLPVERLGRWMRRGPRVDTNGPSLSKTSRPRHGQLGRAMTTSRLSVTRRKALGCRELGIPRVRGRRTLPPRGSFTRL